MKMPDEIDVVEVPHWDDMTIKNFYRHMGSRHPMQGMDFGHLRGIGRDDGAYRAMLAYHERMHILEDRGEEPDNSPFDHIHADSELTE